MYNMDSVDNRGIPRSILPLEERYSARFFELSDVFTNIDLKSSESYEPSSFANISSWSEYRSYMSSDLSEKIKRPWEGVMKYREFNLIGVDIDNE